MKKFSIELVKNGQKAKLYALRYEGAEDNVLMHFLNDDDFQKRKDFDVVKVKIKRMLTHGFYESKYLKHIGNAGDSLYEIKGHRKSGIRLFCLRYGANTVIVSFAGIKSSKIIQENPEHNAERDFLILLDGLIISRIKDEVITYDEQTILTGDLHFEIEDL